MNQPNEPYDRVLFPATVKCTNCRDAIPPAVTAWMVNGQIHCTSCKDKVIQRNAQAEQARLARQVAESLKFDGRPLIFGGVAKDEFLSDDFDADINILDV